MASPAKQEERRLRVRGLSAAAILEMAKAAEKTWEEAREALWCLTNEADKADTQEAKKRAIDVPYDCYLRLATAESSTWKEWTFHAVYRKIDGNECDNYDCSQHDDPRYETSEYRRFHPFTVCKACTRWGDPDRELMERLLRGSENYFTPVDPDAVSVDELTWLCGNLKDKSASNVFDAYRLAVSLTKAQSALAARLDGTRRKVAKARRRYEPTETDRVLRSAKP
jgi:hypothetical protein